MRFSISQQSRQGPRLYNQDRVAYSYSKDALFMVVADGMGGHLHGDKAAQIAVEMLTAAFQQAAQPIVNNPDRFLTHQIMRVHEAIQSLQFENQLEDSPRTTVVVALIQEDKLHCAHVGDSRLYLFRRHKVAFKTEDHSIIRVLVERGMVTKEDAPNHPQRHKIYNCLGGEVTPQIDLAKPLELKDGDGILLCTDGLWTAIKDAEIMKLLHAGSVTESVRKMLEIAETLAGKEGDNLSAVGLHWGSPLSAASVVSTATMPLGMTTTILNSDQIDPNMQSPDLSDDEIDRAIAEIQSAINRTST